MVHRGQPGALPEASQGLARGTADSKHAPIELESK
jgi:hypothetical protein